MILVPFEIHQGTAEDFFSKAAVPSACSFFSPQLYLYVSIYFNEKIRSLNKMHTRCVAISAMSGEFGFDANLNFFLKLFQK